MREEAPYQLRQILVAPTADADQHRVAVLPPLLVFDDPGDGV